MAAFLAPLLIVAGLLLISLLIYRDVRQHQRRDAEETQRKAEETERQCREAAEAQHKAQEAERQRREAEEAQHKAEEEAERQRREAAEAQHKAQEAERQRREAEEAQHKAEEEAERQHREAEEAQRKGREAEMRGMQRQLPPENHGGRPRAVAATNETKPSEVVPPGPAKPEIMCLLRGRQWVVAAELSEELWDRPGLAVRQGGESLEADEREGYWQLHNVHGHVSVGWSEADGPREVTTPLGRRGWLIFKLVGENRREGRLVSWPSQGSYLVMVPDAWERDESVSGVAPTAPEGVSIPGYRAHFFDVETGAWDVVGFTDDSGHAVRVRSRSRRFSLAGACLEDTTEGLGPLFGKTPPRLHAARSDGWSEIATVVIGEEGPGRQKWRRSFTPSPRGTELDVPATASPQNDGWYFVRLHGPDGDLVDSFDFRFIAGLHQINIPQSSPFPCEPEHEALHVELRHDPGLVVLPADDAANDIGVHRRKGATVLRIPASARYDRTRWCIGSSANATVQVTILIERLWWAVGDEDNAPAGWTNELIALACNEFAPTSRKSLWLRLPRRRWTDDIMAGFDRSGARPVALRVNDTLACIPLREFGDCKEIHERERDQVVNVWVRRDRELVQESVAMIPASLGPILCVACGRKKSAVATAVLRKGSGAIKVNGQAAADYFQRTPLRAYKLLQRLLQLPALKEILWQTDAFIEVTGSSPATVQQVKASAHALARALTKHAPRLRSVLRQEGLGGVKVAEPRTTREADR